VLWLRVNCGSHGIFVRGEARVCSAIHADPLMSSVNSLMLGSAASSTLEISSRVPSPANRKALNCGFEADVDLARQIMEIRSHTFARRQNL
jgi:hypothetical protein